MIGKTKYGSIYKIAVSCVFGVLGIFLGNNTAFAQNACKDLTKTITDGSSSAHPYTCETQARASSICARFKDGTVDQIFSTKCPAAATPLVCHRCICPGDATWVDGKCTAKIPTADDCKNLNQILSGTICVSCTPPQEPNAAGTACETVAPPPPPSTNPTADDCKNLNQILSGTLCVACLDPQVPNAAGTACETVASPSKEDPCTPPQKKDFRGTCNACEDGRQRNSSLQGDNKCEDCNDPGVCCGIKLNTTVPFVGNCIRTDNTNADGKQITTTPTNAFPKLMGALTKIMTTVILLICFGAILVGGVMIASSGGDSKRAGDGKALIGKVVIAIAVLGASGIILHLINPNFFG